MPRTATRSALRPVALGTAAAVLLLAPFLLRGGRPSTATADDGALPGGATTADHEYAGIARLDPDLFRALRDASADAARDGVEVRVNSGWRSSAYQHDLFRAAVSERGSAAEAARWVAPADTSSHELGEAVDVGPPEAARWLSAHGAGYGLCQVYGNEPWHFELRAVDFRCPPPYPDVTGDPRTRR